MNKQDQLYQCDANQLRMAELQRVVRISIRLSLSFACLGGALAIPVAHDYLEFAGPAWLGDGFAMVAVAICIGLVFAAIACFVWCGAAYNEAPSDRVTLIPVDPPAIEGDRLDELDRDLDGEAEFHGVVFLHCVDCDVRRPHQVAGNDYWQCRHCGKVRSADLHETER